MLSFRIYTAFFWTRIQRVSKCESRLYSNFVFSYFFLFIPRPFKQISNDDSMTRATFVLFLSLYSFLSAARPVPHSLVIVSRFSPCVSSPSPPAVCSTRLPPPFGVRPTHPSASGGTWRGCQVAKFISRLRLGTCTHVTLPSNKFVYTRIWSYIRHLRSNRASDGGGSGNNGNRAVRR